VRGGFDAEGRALRPLAKDEAELRGWLETLGPWVEPEALAWLDGRLERRPALPRGPFQQLLPRLGLKPYPYQWTGAEFLARTGRALLADEMGLGKTVQAILAAVALRRAENPVRAVTIVCPASLRGGWQDEIRRWIGEDVTPLEGRSLDRVETIASRPRWLVTHYEQVLRDHRHHAGHPPDLLIVDEAQRAKGLRTRTARVLKTIDARYVLALTGTPLENRLEEAYAIAQLIDQRLLPPLWQLDRDHFVRENGGRRVVLYRGLDALRSRLAPAFLRRRKEDVALELPERVRSIVMVPMHDAVVETYDEVMSQVVRIARKKVLLPADLERMQRLLTIARRCCDGPQMLKREVNERKVPKLEELEQALRDLGLGEGRKVVVFSEWTDMTDCVERLCRRLRLPAFHLHGGVPIRRRPGLIRSFSATKGPAVFVSTDAGGVGLNLQAADVVVNLDLPWNPARLEQRVARVHRIGSKGTVQELLMVTKDSVEERILHLHDTKRNVLANIWDKGTEDVIAAPGGSGAFREMVAALLDTQGPEMESRGADGKAIRDHRVRAREGGVEGMAAAPRFVGANHAPAGKTEGSLVVDPAALLAAMGAVAPALPPEHRKSLATVFRVLAESLEA
jgi:SNF2 family DNA or RNA helicase